MVFILSRSDFSVLIQNFSVMGIDDPDLQSFSEVFNFNGNPFAYTDMFNGIIQQIGKQKIQVCLFHRYFISDIECTAEINSFSDSFFFLQSQNVIDRRGR